MTKVGILSPTKITTYKGCSMAYYLRYVTHEKVPSNVRLVFGRRIHYLTDKFYGVNFQSPDSFSKFWKHDWEAVIAGDYLKGKEKENLEIREYPYYTRNKETGKREQKILRVGSHVNLGNIGNPDFNPVRIFFGYMKIGENILKRFYKRHIPEKDPSNGNRNPPIARELSFGAKKNEPIIIGNHRFRGVFDRIDQLNGKFYIADYKTDKSSPGYGAFILHRHPQFTYYSYAFREIFKKREQAILYYHLRSGDVFETHRSEKDYDYAKILADEVAEGIYNDRFVPFYGFHCNFCDLQVSCENYCMDYHGGPKIALVEKIKKPEKFFGWDVDIPEWMQDQVDER